MSKETSEDVASAAGRFMAATDPKRGRLPADREALRHTPLLKVEDLEAILRDGRSGCASAVAQHTNGFDRLATDEEILEGNCRAFHQIVASTMQKYGKIDAGTRLPTWDEIPAGDQLPVRRSIRLFMAYLRGDLAREETVADALAALNEEERMRRLQAEREAGPGPAENNS